MLGGADFAQLAKKESINGTTAQKGGLLSAFSRNSPNIPDSIRQAAFNLADGEISNIIKQDKYYHIIKRDKLLPRTATDYSSVRQQLKDDLIEGRMRAVQQQLLDEVNRNADVRVLNPMLKREVEQATLAQ